MKKKDTSAITLSGKSMEVVHKNDKEYPTKDWPGNVVVFWNILKAYEPFTYCHILNVQFIETKVNLP